MCILILRVAVAEMLSVTSSSHACRERVDEDRNHRRSLVRGDRRGVRGGDSHAGGGPGAATDWLSWHRAWLRQAPVHNPLFFIITVYICYVHLRYRNFMETTCIDIPVLRVLLVQVRVAAMLRSSVPWGTNGACVLGHPAGIHWFANRRFYETVWLGYDLAP